MARTAQQIIDRSIQRSALNNPDLVPTAQLLQYITLSERQAYMRASRINPDYFGKDAVTATRAAFTDSWDLAATPGDVGVLTRAEVQTIVGSVSGVAAGDKVKLIGLRWPEIDVAPRAYVRGRKIFVYANELGANSSNMVTVLKVYYSPVPATVAVTTQSLTIPDEWTDMVAVPLSRLLAFRDRRLDEIAGIDEEFKMIGQLFDESCLAFDHGVRRPISAVPAVQAPAKG